MDCVLSEWVAMMMEKFEKEAWPVNATPPTSSRYFPMVLDVRSLLKMEVR